MIGATAHAQKFHHDLTWRDMVHANATWSGVEGGLDSDSGVGLTKKKKENRKEPASQQRDWLKISWQSKADGRRWRPPIAWQDRVRAGRLDGTDIYSIEHAMHFRQKKQIYFLCVHCHQEVVYDQFKKSRKQKHGKNFFHLHYLFMPCFFLFYWYLLCYVVSFVCFFLSEEIEIQLCFDFQNKVMKITYLE